MEEAAAPVNRGFGVGNRLPSSPTPRSRNQACDRKRTDLGDERSLPVRAPVKPRLRGEIEVAKFTARSCDRRIACSRLGIDELHPEEKTSPPRRFRRSLQEALRRHFRGFVELLFPVVAAEIDSSVALVFLDKELQAAVRKAVGGRRHADVFVRVVRSSAGAASSSTSESRNREPGNSRGECWSESPAMGDLRHERQLGHLGRWPGRLAA